jgi:catechol 2,3-dioxygenase-like lactoylglutathione lyase family enzyme
MTFEHFALNVPDVRAQARWYVEQLGFRVLRQRAEPPYTHFLADDSGRPIMELYTNLAAPRPDYAANDPLCFHVAVIARDARAEQKRLVAAGASFVLVDELSDGTVLVMLRDPWGVPLQLCQRVQPLA